VRACVPCPRRYHKFCRAARCGADVGVTADRFAEGLASLQLHPPPSAAESAALFAVLDAGRGGGRGREGGGGGAVVVGFDDFARVVFETDNMVIESVDHKKQQAADRAASLAGHALAAGRIPNGRALLAAFRRKVEGQPNVSLAFSKFRRLAVGNNNDDMGNDAGGAAALTQQEFNAAMMKWGFNTTQAALGEMWALLQKDDQGRLNFEGFAKSVVGEHSALATLQVRRNRRGGGG
jgi:hypothetical protein